HIIYRQPVGLPIRSSKHRLGHPKLEIKGDGGYIIGPPSVHASGRAYLAEGTWNQIADAPDWLIQLLTDQPPTPAQHPLTVGPTPGDITQRRLNGLAGAVAIATEGNRNDTLNWAAYNAGRMIGANLIPEHAAVEALQTAALRAGLT